MLSDQFNYNIIWFFILSLLIVNILLLRYIFTVKKYIRELAQAYDAVAKGQYGHRIRVSMSGDIGKAGQSFNLMTQQVMQNIEELWDKNSKLHAILKSISNGIIVVDSEENIMLVNQAAIDLMELPSNYEGRLLRMNFRNEQLREKIVQMIYSAEEEVIQTEIDNIWYKIKVDPVRIEGKENLVIGNIINIEDVTQRVRLEQMRRDFVANVTHELKTPLTSINGFVETLREYEEIDREKRRRFLDIIKLESDRLQRLINDILSLSMIENCTGEYADGEFSVNETIEDCVKLLERTAEEKKIDLMVNVAPEHLLMPWGEDLFKQLMLNLIDNGIKYSGEGSRVYVRVFSCGSEICVEVEDNGIGIPQEEIPRVFERFYRIDKARSKKEGGTGLGLAIAKHIVIRFGGQIHLRSEVGKGTLFTVNLPKRQEDGCWRRDGVK